MTEPASRADATARIRRRLIPFLFILYIVSYLDRINVGFAALQMNRALGFSPTTFGLGAGIFFLSYVAFEIPSNVVLARVGARLWIARIMITWGLVSAGMMFVQSAAGFFGLRFLLGAAEAGFFPGIIFYLTRWIPARDRAHTIAAFMTATLIAGVIGGPVSGALLSLDGRVGLAGWQWLFLLEGVPAVLLGVAVLFFLDDEPQQASWLTGEERATLASRLREDDDQPGARAAHTLRDAMTSSRIWLLAAVYFSIPVALYAVGFWLPQIVKGASGASDFVVGVLTAIPYLAGAIAMVIVARHSDRTSERRWHVALPAIVGGAAFAASAATTGVTASLVLLSIAMMGLASMFGPFWTFATAFVRGVGAAGGIALINSVGNIGGFVGPYLLGAVRDATHSFGGGLVAIGVLLAALGSLVLLVDDPGRRG